LFQRIRAVPQVGFPELETGQCARADEPPRKSPGTRGKDALAARLEQNVEPQRAKLADLEKELAALETAQAGLDAKYKAKARGSFETLKAFTP
jgi:hypothetical protein